MLHRIAALSLLVLLPSIACAQIEPETLRHICARGPIHSVVTRSQGSTDSLLFDRKGRLVEEFRSEKDGEAVATLHTRYDYDSTGRLRRMLELADTLPSAIVECRYDSSGRRRCEQVFRMAPKQQLVEETYFSYAHEGHIQSISQVTYMPDGARRDSGVISLASLLNDRPEERGWVRTISGGGPSAEVSYRDTRGIVRRRVVGRETAPTTVDDFDSTGFLVGMFRWTNSGKAIVYYLVNDTDGNPLRRIMGYVDAYPDYLKRAISAKVETEFVYQVDPLGNWIRREEKTRGQDDMESNYRAQTLELQTREIVYWQ